MRFTTLVIIPNETTDINGQVTVSMAPYDLTQENVAEGYWDGWILHDVQMDVFHLPHGYLKRRDILAVVTPDGVWHELGYRWDETAQEQGMRLPMLTDVLAAYPRYLAVEIDCHS